MELNSSELATEDVISSLPDNVVTHILECLQVQDAVKTSILSRNWRFKWNFFMCLSSKLVFDDNFFMCLSSKGGEKGFGRFISKLLLHLKGAITKFVLVIDDQFYSLLDDGDIEHWILFLSRKGVKDLTIVKTNGKPLKLPTHLFSCLELKHLKLSYCHFDPPASFHGFPNLLTLKLDQLWFESSKFEEFIIQCPLIEILEIRNQILPFNIWNRNYQLNFFDILKMLETTTGEVNLVAIAKLANLKSLSLSLCNTVMITNSDSILELVGFLPKLQDLYLDFERFKFTEDGAENRTFTTFPCLKALKLSTIESCNDIMLSCALELIRSFPNLQTLEITASDSDDDPTPAICSPDVDNTMELLQLQSVVFTRFKGSENEVYLIKYLLACSPFLKKIVVHPHLKLGSDEKFECARKLLKLHRASPVAEIDI